MAATDCVDGSLVPSLPNDILESIIYPLNLKHRATASLVSPIWRHLISSFTNPNSVQSKLSHTNCGNCVTSCDSCYSVRRVKKLAKDSAVTEFFCIVRSSNPNFFNLPPIEFNSTSLTALHLKHCKIEEGKLEEIGDLPLLKEVCFDLVDINACAFFKLIEKCPSLVELFVKDCKHLYTITVPNLTKLRKLDVIGSAFWAVNIEARNLREFRMLGTAIQGYMRLNLPACIKKLQVMKIDFEYFPIDTHVFHPSLGPDDMAGSSLREVEVQIKNLDFFNHLQELMKDFTKSLGETFTLSLGMTGFQPKRVCQCSWDKSEVQPIGIKHINVRILFPQSSECESLMYIVDILFTMFRPRGLSVTGCTKDNIMQILTGVLKVSTRECTCFGNELWRRCLKEFKLLESNTKIRDPPTRLEFQWDESEG